MFLSLGVGVQSSTLLLMSYVGEIETFQAAIFADTQGESKATYRYIDYLDSIVGNKIQIHRVTAGNLKEDVLQGIKNGNFPAIPFHMRQGKSRALMQRKCTVDYKIIPIQRHLRSIGVKSCHLALGISFDEIMRAKHSRLKWIENIFPLIDLRMTRSDCIVWMKRHNFPIPPKSACLFCPFHDDEFWHDLKANSPQEWDEAVCFDEAIRNLPKISMQAFLHRKAFPLSEIVQAQKSQQTFDFAEECEGHCGV